MKISIKNNFLKIFSDEFIPDKQEIIPNFELNNKTNILEVGAGIGTTLNLLNRNFNCNVSAIEPSNEARRMISDLGTVKIVGKYAEDLDGLNYKKKYDCIIFSHSLENTLHPDQIIGMASKVLGDNGIIYIQAANLFTFDQMNPYHPYIFSYQSLKYIASLNKLKIKRVGEKIDKMLSVVLTK